MRFEDGDDASTESESPRCSDCVATLSPNDRRPIEMFIMLVCCNTVPVYYKSITYPLVVEQSVLSLA